MSEVLLAGSRVQLLLAHSCISVTFALPETTLTNRWGKGNDVLTVSQQTLDTCVSQSDGSTVQFMTSSAWRDRGKQTISMFIGLKCMRCPWALHTERSISLLSGYFSPRRGCPRVHNSYRFLHIEYISVTRLVGVVVSQDLKWFKNTAYICQNSTQQTLDA